MFLLCIDHVGLLALESIFNFRLIDCYSGTSVGFSFRNDHSFFFPAVHQLKKRPHSEWHSCFLGNIKNSTILITPNIEFLVCVQTNSLCFYSPTSHGLLLHSCKAPNKAGVAERSFFFFFFKAISGYRWAQTLKTTHRCSPDTSAIREPRCFSSGRSSPRVCEMCVCSYCCV